MIYLEDQTFETAIEMMMMMVLSQTLLTYSTQWIEVVLHESRVEPLIPARFGDFSKVRPGLTFDHKGSVGSRTGSEKEILWERVNYLPNCIHFLAPIFQI